MTFCNLIEIAGTIPQYFLTVIWLRDSAKFDRIFHPGTLMRHIFSALFSCFVLITVAFVSFEVPPASAEPESVFVPEALRPWVDWVKDKQPDRVCTLVRNERVCSWPGKVVLDLNASGGTFQMSAVVERRGEVALPGGGEVWPTSVTVGTNALAIFESNDRPAAILERGRYEITGRFSWDRLPQALLLPPEVGVVDLRVEGQRIALPKFDDGSLWLEENSEAADEVADSVQVNVSRKLTDGIPFHLFTNVELRVSGKSRELPLGNILPTGFAPVGVDSPLIYKLDQDWNLTVQVLPGVFNLRIDAVQAQPPASVGIPSVTAPGWPRDETWVFEAVPDFRAVQIDGATAVDPDRTRLPDEWKSLPAYIVTADTPMILQELRRGEREVAPNKLSLFRTAWLDLDGEGMTVQDVITGQMNRDWRLNTQPGVELTNVRVDGKQQVITKEHATNAQGVEIRNETVNVQAVSRLGSAKTISAVGWDHDVDSLGIDLNVGPGWSLLNVSGVDNDPRTWFSTWTLWDIFFLCLMSIAVAKLLGLSWGVVTFVALTLCHGQLGAPVYIWLNILAGKALLMKMPDGRAKSIVRIYYLVSFGLLLSVFIPFAIDQIRLGLFPQLYPAFRPGELFTMILVPTIAIGSFCAFVGSIVMLFRREFGRAFQFFLLSGLLFVGIFATFAVFGLLSSPATRMAAFQEIAGDAAYAPAPTAVPMAPQSKMRRLSSEDLPTEGSEEQSLAADSIEVLRQRLLQTDPAAVVQTGTAVPTWNWQRIRLNWTGPVDKSRTVTLYLLGPTANCLLAFARVVLLLLLGCAFIGMSKVKTLAARTAPVILMFLFMRGDANAEDFPSETLLNELEQRIYRDECTSDCVNVPSIVLSVSGDELTVDAEIASDGSGGWPIPGPSDQFLPSFVALDKNPLNEFRRTSDGFSWIRIPSGAHHVTVKGSLHGKSSVTLQFGIVPKHIEVRAPEWTIDGLSPTGSSQETVQLIRRASESDSAEKAAATDVRLAEWYIVRREFGIGLPWTIENTAERLGDVDRAQIIKLPLLPGESVTGGAVKSESGFAVLVFSRNERSIRWSSTLKQEPVLELKAVSGLPVTESWVVRCSAIWRCQFEGLAPTATKDSGEYAGVYKPWPGEELKIEVSRPEGVSGQTATVDSATLTWRPGQGLLQGALQFAIRTSQGGWRKIELPQGAALESVTLNGAPQSLALENGQLALPLSPGSQQFDIQWRQPFEIGFYDALPRVNLGTNVGNVNVVVNVPTRRWVLWTGGPRWGPAVLFWGALVVVALFAGILGRYRVPPLNGRQWMLLGLGMATLHPAFIALPAAVFGLLEYRRQHPLAERWRFNALQVLLGIMSAVTLIVLFLSIYHGLIVEPDMGISGNNSSNDTLRWFVDRSSGELPQPWIVTVPLWSWKILMLAWSCWLVFSILKWPRWFWSCFTEGGAWRSKGELPSAPR